MIDKNKHTKMEMKAYHGVDSCSVELKEISQHWLRRRDVINKMQNTLSISEQMQWCTYFAKSQHCIDDIV